MLNSSVLITNSRHLDALNRALASVERAILEIDNKESLEFIALDTKQAWLALGEITGENSTEEIINIIFSKFCLGK